MTNFEIIVSAIFTGINIILFASNIYKRNIEVEYLKKKIQIREKYIDKLEESVKIRNEHIDDLKNFIVKKQYTHDFSLN